MKCWLFYSSCIVCSICTTFWFMFSSQAWWLVRHHTVVGITNPFSLLGAEDSQVAYWRVHHLLQPTSHGQECAVWHVPSPSEVTLWVWNSSLMEGAISLFFVLFFLLIYLFIYLFVHNSSGYTIAVSIAYPQDYRTTIKWDYNHLSNNNTRTNTLRSIVKLKLRIWTSNLFRVKWVP